MDANSTARHRERGPLWPAAVWLLAIASVTLTPGGGGKTISEICILCGHRGLADFLLNVGLFVPLGAALALRRLGFRKAAEIGFAVTMVIEAAQLSVIPGRDANVGDVLANGSGALAGWWLGLRGVPLVRRARRRGPWAALAAAAMVVFFLLGTQQLFRPAFAAGTYFTQWAAEFGGMGRFTGEVLGSRVGPMVLDGPPWRIERSDSVRRLLEEGAPIEVRIVTGEPQGSAAPIFSIYDGEQQEVFMLAQGGDGLLLRFPQLGGLLRLDTPFLRAGDVLASVPPGRQLEVGVLPRERGYCIRAGEETRCDVGFTVGNTWMLLYAPDAWGLFLRDVVSLVWLAALFVPVGALVADRRTGAAVAVLAISGLVLGPWATGMIYTPAGQIAAAVLGITLGALVASPVFVDTHGRSEFSFQS